MSLNPSSDDNMPQQPPTTTAPPQQTVYIVVQPTTTPDAEHYRKNFPSRIVASIGAAQLFVFAVGLILEIILLVNVRNGPPVTVGSGMWCGVFLGVAGVLGLVASWKPTNCTIVAYMVLSIISAVFAAFPTVLGGIGIAVARRDYTWDSDGNRIYGPSINKALYGMLCFCGLCQLVLGVAASILCCRGVCCRSNKTTGAVIYNPNAAPGGEDGCAGAADRVQVQAALLSQDAIQVPLGAAAALTAQAPPTTAVGAAAAASSMPPKYEEAAGEKYQRFQ